MADFVGVMDLNHPGVPIKFADLGDGTFGLVTADPEDSGNIIIAASGNVANANAVSTLAGTAGKTTYLNGFTAGGGGATAASVVTVTITGLLGGTLSYTYGVGAGASGIAETLSVNFSEPLAASAANTPIVVTLPALGLGNTNATTTAYGFQL